MGGVNKLRFEDFWDLKMGLRFRRQFQKYCRKSKAVDFKTHIFPTVEQQHQFILRISIERLCIYAPQVSERASK